MKVNHFFLLICFCLIATSVFGQRLKPNYVSVSYLGEMITHPGLNISAHYRIKSWDKKRVKKNDTQIKKDRSINLSPSLKFFYHKRYQNGLSSAINLNYHSLRNGKWTFGTGIGVGYLRTFIPNTFVYNENGTFEKKISGHNYVSSNIFLSWGRKINSLSNNPMEVYIKPQYWIAFPNFPNTVSYFMFEVGLTIDLKKSKK
ncbi:MAG: hypothetical protein MI810_20270 [Flavobacteriales bacterium]|nr:hypothetical protein [Flavobacteriales bacterium]